MCRIRPLWGLRIPFLLAASLVFSLLSGCSSAGDRGGTIEEGIGIARIESVSRTQRVVRFEVSGLWPNTCGRFSHFESSKDEDTYRVQMFAEQPKGALCRMVNTRVAGTWETAVPEEGTYTFEFVRTINTVLDTTLVFE